jgi:hypothetical protein
MNLTAELARQAGTPISPEDQRLLELALVRLADADE